MPTSRRLKTLLAELTPLRHSARMARMVEVGRLAQRDPPTRKTIAELATGSFFERLLALQSCLGSRDGALAVTFLSDRSALLRGRARVVAVDVCDDAQMLTAMEALPQRALRHVLRLLALRQRCQVVDACLARQNVEGSLDGASLAYASEQFVAPRLEAVMASGVSGPDIRRLASFHPRLVAERLIEAASVSEVDPRLVPLALSALRELTNKASQQALQLVAALLQHVPIAQLSQVLARLKQYVPNEVADLVLSHDEESSVSLAPVARRLTAERREQLLRERPGALPIAPAWFHELPVAERAALFETFERGWRDSDGCLPVWVVEVLPAAARVREARAHWRHAPLAVKPLQRFPYAACLPWEEAQRELEPFIRNPDPELRAPAGACLVATCRFERVHNADALQFALARKNEQDPVRRAFLGALAALPPSRWQAADLPVLSEILRQALDAADLSVATASAIEALVVRLIPFQSDWAIPWLATLVSERGRVNLGRLDLRLNDAEVRKLAPALLPVLHAWDTRERQHQLVAAAWSLQRRLRVFPEFVEILESMAFGAQAWSAASALGVIAVHLPERLAALAPELLAKDKSWITQSVVYWHLHLCRQDLLTPYLGRRAYPGRFSTGRTRFLLPVASGFYRWAPDQVETFDEVLEEVARDEQRDTPTVLSVIRQMSALPGVVSPALLRFSHVKNPKLVTRDASLRALGRLDEGQGASLLLEALSDDRGRIAIYALRATILEMPAEQGLAVLRGTPLEKVTIAKEVVRLLGDLHSRETWRLLAEWDARDLHRDVRVALLRALWNHLNREETWDIIDRAAVSTDAAIATMAGRTTSERMSDRAHDRLVQVLATLLGHPDPKVRCNVLERCAAEPVKDIQQALLPRLLARLESAIPDEVRTAAGAVFATYVGRQASAVAEAINILLSRHESLQIAVATLTGRLHWNRRRLLPTARAVLAVLARDRLATVLEMDLATAALSGQELATYLTQRAADLHAEACMTAISGIAARHDLRNRELEELESALTGQSDAQLRRLALASLTRLAANPPGWTDEVRGRLAQFRRDPAALVATVAAFTFPPRQPLAEDESDAAVALT